MPLSKHLLGFILIPLSGIRKESVGIIFVGIYISHQKSLPQVSFER